MNFNIKSKNKNELIDTYKELVTPRIFEEKMLILLRQGKISKWFSGIGQEAIAVGVGIAMHKEEYILPMHRNLGIFTTRKIPFDRLFAQFQGKSEGFTKGRDRSFHFGTQEYKIVGMISHLGPQLAIADGIALSHLLKKEKKVCAVFSGDGGSSEGDFHEALNVASVWKLPVIFVIENNGYGLSTPNSEQFHFDSFIQKGPAYGIDALSIDGNNVLEVIANVSEIRNSLKKTPRPFILEARTFRMRGHEEASGVKYIPPELLEEWAKKDPIFNYENFLIKKGILDENQKQEIKKTIKKTIDDGIKKASAYHPVSFKEENEMMDIYVPHLQKTLTPDRAIKKFRFVDAISDALKISMEKHPDLILMGQDIAGYGGVFKITDGFSERYGKERVRNTPLCESAIIGIGLGLSICKMKSVIEMQFADFVTCGFNQIINNLAKTHYRWGQNVDVVIRMPTGAGLGAGPFHSQSNEAWFFHTPGLKIVYPSNPYDAKGLLIAAIDDPNPYLFFEHKKLYRSLSEDIPTGEYLIEIGKAKVKKEGTEAVIITYGMGVVWAMDCIQELGLNIEILDLVTLLPWDKKSVKKSVKKCNRVLVLHEDSLTGGIGAEIAAWITENCFEYLDAPIQRVGALDTPVPFAHELEENFLPEKRLKKAVKKILEY